MPEFAHLEDERCDRCYRMLSVGAHGVGLCPFEPRRGHSIVRDEIPGGQVFENGFKDPQKFYSHSEHRRALAATGHEIRAHWVPNDKVLSRWDTVDLDKAKALVERYSVKEPDLTPGTKKLARELAQRLAR